MSTADQRRPLSIVILCCLAVIGIVLGAAYVPFMLKARAIGAWYVAYIGGAAVVGLASLWGYWRMKRWGIFLYALLTLVNQVVLYRMNHGFAIQSLLMPMIVISVGLWNWKDMD